MNPIPSAEMDVGAVIAGTPRPAAGLARWTALAMLMSLAIAAVVLCWRRMAGALVTPLDVPAALAAGLLIAVIATAGRMAWRLRRAASSVRTADRRFTILVSSVVVLLAATLSIPGTHPGGLVLLWLVLAVQELVAWRTSGPSRLALPFPRLPAAGREIRVDQPEPVRPHSLPPIPSQEVPPAQTVTQQITRSATASGGEVMRGWLRVPFAAGQRTATVHLAFCPQFARTPRVSLQQAEGPPARIKTVQVLPYGSRFDLKLSAPQSSSEAALFEFTAESEPL